MAAKEAGRTSRRFRMLAANVRAQRKVCCHCGQRIDYTLPAGHPDSFTVEHIQPRSTHPHLAEEPANLDAAHLRCNSSRGNRVMRPSIGVTSQPW